MAGGGIIIIRNRLKTTAADSVVVDHVASNKKQLLQSILAKNEGDWTDAETHFVIRRIAEAYDAQC